MSAFVPHGVTLFPYKMKHIRYLLVKQCHLTSKG